MTKKWGIDHKAAAFRRGRTEDRTVIPDWLKNNCVWLHGHGHEPTSYDSIIKSQKLLGVPCASHIYTWSKYPYDTHYPNWIPAQDNHISVMPYFNGHMADMNYSPTFYKGKTLIVFANIFDRFVRIYWESDYKSLGLKKKNIYKCRKYIPKNLTKQN